MDGITDRLLLSSVCSRPFAVSSLHACSAGVEGIIICNYEGVALKSTLTPALTAKYAGLLSQLVVKARGVIRTIDAEVR